jgi:hypothetical protein
VRHGAVLRTASQAPVWGEPLISIPGHVFLNSLSSAMWLSLFSEDMTSLWRTWLTRLTLMTEVT